MKLSPFVFFLTIIFLCRGGEIFAQSSSTIISNRLRMVAMGKIEEVRNGIPELARNFPEDEGVLFLEAVVTDNPLRAQRIYEGIVRNKPKSEWADDAQLRIVQYFSLKRDTARAHTELQNYRMNYPTSEFLLTANDIVKATVGLPRENPRAISGATTTTNATTVLKTPPAIKEAVKEPLKTTPKVENPKFEKPKTDISKVEIPKKEVPKTEVLKPLPQKTEIPTVEKPAEEVVLKPVRFALQIAIYTDHEAAQSEVNRFKNKRMRASIITKDIEGKSHFAVVIGDYSTRESAEKVQPVVQTQCECAPFIIEK